MSGERLQEIKDSLNAQYEIARSDNKYQSVYLVLDEEQELVEEVERLNKCIDEALEIIIKDWNDKCTIPIHAVVDTGNDIRIKLYYQLFFKGVDKE